MNTADMQRLIHEVAKTLRSNGCNGGDETFAVDPAFLRSELERLHPEVIRQLDRRRHGAYYWVKRWCPRP